jgi:hypothetical protein
VYIDDGFGSERVCDTCVKEAIQTGDVLNIGYQNESDYNNECQVGIDVHMTLPMLSTAHPSQFAKTFDEMHTFFFQR